MMRRRAASSSGVQAANDLSRQHLDVGGHQPEHGLRSLVVAVAQLGRRHLQHGLGLARRVQRGLNGLALARALVGPRKNRRNTRS